jgi:Fe-S-cluster-containing dehydrogenase component
MGNMTSKNRFGLLIDITKCNGCYNCFLACRDEHCGNDHLPYSLSQPSAGHFWMRINEKERGKYPKVKVAYIPLLCMHCNNPSCCSISTNNEVYQRPDGIVIIDPEKSKGKKEIVSACPYRVIYWNEDKNIPQKCTFCYHLLDAGWKEPRCVEVCPTGALVFGDINNPDSEISKLLKTKKFESLHPEFGLKENVRYFGLPQRFIAGTVIFNDKDECVENAVITLTGAGLTRDVKSNNYGDFEFEDIPIDKKFTIKIEYPGYLEQVIETDSKIDVYLGRIKLSPA